MAMKLYMTVEVDVRDVFAGESCLKREELIAGNAMLLVHSNQIMATVGQMRVIEVHRAEEQCKTLG